MYEIEIEAERRVIYFVFGLDIFVTSDYDKIEKIFHLMLDSCAFR